MYKSIIVGALLVGSVFAGNISEKTTIGGYGEFHLNYTNEPNGKSESPVLDFHRWVLFVRHDFNEQWGINTELELEHNFVSDNQGELKLEQAYLEYRPFEALNARLGVLLMSSGLINTNHEPTTFLSVERPLYSKYIIPTTWFGSGLSVSGNIKGMATYSAAVMEGLDDRKFSAKNAIRKGRQGGYKTNLDNLAFNVAGDYIMIPGLRVGGSVVWNTNVHDIDTANPYLYDNTLVSEIHVQYKAKGLHLTSEFGVINYWAKEGVSAPVSLSQGIYLEGGYNVARIWDAKELQLIPFVRYSQVNTAGQIFKNSNRNTPFTQKIMGGLSLMPIKNIAIKFDYAAVQSQFEKDVYGEFNFGMGYEF